MTIKAVIFDIDGVIITNGYSFSKHMRDYYLDKEDDMKEFFSGDFRQTSIGKKDLKEILEPRFEGWNWHLGADKFLDLWFLTDGKLDMKVLDLVQALREKGIICGVASNQEKYRKQFLLDEIGLADRFDKAYFSCDFGVCKPGEDYYKQLVADLGLKPEEILFMDDDIKNVEGAKNVGIQTIHYTEFGCLEEHGFFKDFL